jgi:hypothetical protein
MSKPKDSQPEVIFSRKAENNYNLEDKKKKLKAMKVSPLIMKMYEDRG